MEWIIEPEKKTPVVEEVDLLVCGGGFAGVAAAVCAARLGARVKIIEKYGFLGGLVTSALVITTPPLDNGINQEISHRLKGKGVYSPCHNSGNEIEWLNMHAIDPEVVKYELVQMLKEGGVEILLHTYIVNVFLSGEKIQGVITENKAGRQAIRAKMIIDATGDADIAAFAGVPFRKVRKPITLMFNMVGVDIKEALGRIDNWGNLKKILHEAIEKGEISFDLGTQMEYGAPGVHAEKLVYDDEINVWSGNLLNVDGLDAEQVTQAELITREHTMKLANFFKSKIPGFAKARIEYTATQTGIRATRQIIGRASPGMDEVMGKNLDDIIVKPYRKTEMRLPFGSILPLNLENLLVAGRCISAQEEAMGQLRLIPVCSATGQAAGVAAALALQQEIQPSKLNISILQRTLSNQGMDLGIVN